jgi:hypothetical protein
VHLGAQSEAGRTPFSARTTFKVSTDPQMESKVRDVVGLYLNPPQKAVHAMRLRVENATNPSRVRRDHQLLRDLRV